MSISENYNDISHEIKQILEKCGRPNEEVRIIAVSKTVDIDKVHELDATTCHDIGENKPQELVRKYDDVKDRYRCHMIGHLQTNKVKDVIDKAVLIHGLDRSSLVKEIEKRAKKDGKSVKCLIQLNIGQEEQKSGIYLENLEDLLAHIESCDYVKVKGLMTIAPFTEDPEEIRWVFRKMKEIFDDLNTKEFSNIKMEYLSMGMTNDYKIAIEEGANMVRVGTAIFGKRKYN